MVYYISYNIYIVYKLYNITLPCVYSTASNQSQLWNNFSVLGSEFKGVSKTLNCPFVKCPTNYLHNLSNWLQSPIKFSESGFQLQRLPLKAIIVFFYLKRYVFSTQIISKNWLVRPKLENRTEFQTMVVFFIYKWELEVPRIPIQIVIEYV